MRFLKSVLSSGKKFLQPHTNESIIHNYFSYLRKLNFIVLNTS